MVKIVWVSAVSLSMLVAQGSFEKRCVPCHERVEVDLREAFMHYLKMVGGKKNFKASLKRYFKYPLKDIAVMPELIEGKYSVKKELHFESKELEEAIEEYWEKYKIIGKLR